MGCGHAKAQNFQPGPGLFSYSAGWRWTGNDNDQYCSVMTYEAGTYFADGITHTRVAYFSSPAIQYLGADSGNAADGDNARTIRETATVVASYRSALPSVVVPYTYTTNNGSITITKYTGSGGAVAIPDSINGLPVTSVGVGAFDSCNSLTSVTIPDSVTSIGTSAFNACSGLTSVTIGKGVATIGTSAFNACSSLISVVIPDSVTSIGTSAFNLCDSLASVTIGNGVATIGTSAFNACSSLTSVTIGNGVTSINISAFQNCSNLTSVYFQGNAPKLGLSAFSGDNKTIIYRLSGATGWPVVPATWGGRPTALWGPVYFLTINGGTGGGAYTNQQRVTITADAPTFGTVFDRWSGATQYLASGTSSTTTVTMPAQAISLTATYMDIYCTLTATSAYGGSVPAGTNSYLFNTSVSAMITNSPLQNGTTQYVCNGWAGTGSVPASGATTNTGLFTMTNDATLVWLWTTNYLMDTATNGNGTVNVPDGWWPKGSNVQIMATAANHYHFTGWTGQTNGCTIISNVITAPMTTPRAITANFVVDQHSLIVTTPYGKASPSIGTNWFNWNGSVAAALTNSPVLNGTTQYVCTGWSGTGSVPPSGTGTNTGLFTLTNNSSVAWQWATNYWLDTVTNGNGTVNQVDQWCLAGSNLVITATSSVSNRFTGWTGQTNGCNISSNQITVAMTTPRQITANFVRQYGLAVSTPYGTGSLPNGTNLFDSGASVTVMMTNSPVTIGTTQYVCRGWTGTGSAPASGNTTNTGVFTVTNDSVIIWNWRTNYWLHADATGSGSVSTSDVWVASGTNIQVTATPDSYYVFDGWQGQTNGCAISGNKITVVMNTSRFIGAVFIADITTNDEPKWWLAQYGLTNFNADAMSDVDLDGLNAWQEYIAGTDPTNRASVLEVQLSTGSSANQVSWYGVNGRYYQLEYTDNLANGWTPQGLVIPGANAQIMKLDITSGAKRFYRIRVSNSPSGF